MNDMTTFEEEEIIKRLESIGVLEDNYTTDKSEYFNAWNFGQPEGEYEFSIGTVITTPEALKY